MNNVLFSDEATFHTCDLVNRHNCKIWAMEQVHENRDWQRDTPKVNVWLGITKSTVYGPFMFGEPTFNGSSYLDMLQQFLEPVGSQWNSGYCCLPAGWGTSPFCSHCPGLLKWYISRTMDWPWVTNAVGSPFSRRNSSRFLFFCLGICEV